MKGFTRVLVALLLAVSFPILVFANNLEEQNIIVVKQQEEITKDFFAAGDAIRNHGKIRGDAFVAGGEFENTGQVMGDVLAVSGSGSIGGQIDGDVRIAVGNLVITGEISRNVTAFTGDFLLGRSGIVDGSVNVFAGNVVIDGMVGGDLRSGSGNIRINGVIKGDVELDTGSIAFGPEAKIEGDLQYISDREMKIPEGIVSGKIVYKKPEARPGEVIGKKAEKGFKVLNLVWKAVSIGAYLVIATLFVLLFDKFTKKTASTIDKKPWHALGIGLVALIIIPVAAILLMVTVIGIPLGILSLILYGVLIYLAKLPVSLWLGKVILKEEEKLLVPTLLGVVILKLVSYIPYVGSFVSLVVILFGLGVYLINIKEAIEKNRKSNIVELP